MAQKPQCLSQPSATFTYAHGAWAGGRGRFKRSKLGRGPFARYPQPAAPGELDRAHQTRPPGRPPARRRPAPARSARPCTRSRPAWRPAFLAPASSSTAPIDSSRAASMKAHVLTTSRSASSGRRAGGSRRSRAGRRVCPSPPGSWGSRASPAKTYCLWHLSRLSSRPGGGPTCRRLECVAGPSAPPFRAKRRGNGSSRHPVQSSGHRLARLASGPVNWLRRRQHLVDLHAGKVRVEQEHVALDVVPLHQRFGRRGYAGRLHRHRKSRAGWGRHPTSTT